MELFVLVEAASGWKFFSTKSALESPFFMNYLVSCQRKRVFENFFAKFAVNFLVWLVSAFYMTKQA